MIAPHHYFRPPLFQATDTVRAIYQVLSRDFAVSPVKSVGNADLKKKELKSGRLGKVRNIVFNHSETSGLD
ncbi:hypothetical protein NX722_12590 [Endozoicomonas gorgoniicola]|uniref:Uncharacterized protein n=1 Tax=Endozoicomonas gorgoniicola TaxID=1234144 RepID=A0ABT3MVS0_9GAMM|nr:hypothetical protein [Endozoicomonas gorgoniicola]MCW7553458.1 hypothetical protein [Endozoicomonas gorgoniicola]